jgi:carbon-monoxide dehydrogenase medium subunit
MKPAAFRYIRAHSVAEAVGALEEHGDAAKLLAGGQSLMTMMNLRLAQPEILIDIGSAGLSGISLDGALEIGAMTTQNAALKDAGVRRVAPLMARALEEVGHHTLRNRGTVGGSIAHADPAAELPAVMLALCGEMVVEGPAGVRTIGADDFFVTRFTTALEGDELVSKIRLPGVAPDAWAFHEIARRHGDFALAGMAAAFKLGSDRTITEARVALFSVADRPLRVAAVEKALVGRKLGDRDAAAEAGKAASRHVDPVGDIHGSTEFRKHLAGVVVRRGLATATIDERSSA